MKLANAPGRKNDRQKKAKARLQKRPSPFTEAQKEELRALIARIMPDTVARGVRTKKDRTSRARLRNADK